MTEQQPPQATYNDDDLVYVDPESRTVVGKVEWAPNDRPKSKAYKPVPKPEAPAEKAKDAKPGRKEKEKDFSWRKNYPWGTYKSMKKIYKLEGKIKEPEPNRTLEEVLPKALSQAYWND